MDNNSVAFAPCFFVTHSLFLHHNVVFKLGISDNVNLMSNGSSIKYKQVPEGVFVYTSSLSADPDDTIIQLTTN